MEFLKKVFNNWLNESGQVEIAGYTFFKDEVLNTMDEIAYNQAFLDWKEVRKNALLEKADAILNSFGTEGRFKVLQSKYQKNRIVPFVGAGMSIRSGYSGWTNFLYKLREETTISETILGELLDQGAYERAAQVLFDDMPANAFNEALDNEYNFDNDIVGAVQYLPYIFSSSVITTNFDNVLKRCYDNSNKSFSETILGTDTQELARLISSEEKLLVKLHGKANSSLKRVLTESEYNTHYSKEDVLKKAIEIISSNSLLFLGCSLSTDRTIKTMIEIAEEKGLDNIPRHYAFIALNNNCERLSRRDELAKANIHPIWYDVNDDHDECIEALLLKLSEGENID